MIYHVVNNDSKAGLPRRNNRIGFTLAEGATHVDKLNNVGKIAFTMAEVLITLGIIGIVAAMTLPTLIVKYKENAWTVSFLRVYSILENAYQLAISEYGDVRSWSGIGVVVENEKINIADYRDKYFILNAFKPNLPISQIYDLENSKNCMPNKSYFLNGKQNNMNLSYYVPTVELKSGECIAFGAAYPSLHSFFFVDTNGKNLPNTLGKDQFIFKFAVRRIAPFGWSDKYEECDRNQEQYNAGKSCGAWIVRYKNMDYLHLTSEEIQKQWNSDKHYWD
ncbi:MAG: type II secretion system protein [Candidatus Gastranaerophilaceae bacterium]